MIAEVKHRFTTDEMRELGDRLAHRAQEVERLRGEQKTVAAAIKAGIEAAMGEMRKIAGAMAAGHEMRAAECSVFYHTPRHGVKTYMPASADDEPREEAMTPADLQQNLAFGGEGKAQ